MKLGLRLQAVIGLGLLAALAACFSPPTPAPGGAPPLPHSFKGYELYAWPADGDWRFTLITGANRAKTAEEILTGENSVTADGWARLSVQGVPALQALLRRLPAREEIFWSAELPGAPASDPAGPTVRPPAEMVAGLQDYCRQLDLQLSVEP